MKVRELIEQLGRFDGDQEVCVCRGGSWMGHELHDADDVHGESRILGIATRNPETRHVVVIDTGMCGL